MFNSCGLGVEVGSHQGGYTALREVQEVIINPPRTNLVVSISRWTSRSSIKTKAGPIPCLYTHPKWCLGLPSSGKKKN